MQSPRRHFMILAASLASSIALSGKASAETPAVSERDPTAQSLGYRADATQVDKVKYSKYQPCQHAPPVSSIRARLAMHQVRARSSPVSRSRRRGGAART